MTYSFSKKSANLPLMEQKLLDQKGREQAGHSKNSRKRGNEGPPIG